jgi:hypothetical protein
MDDNDEQEDATKTSIILLCEKCNHPFDKQTGKRFRGGYIPPSIIASKTQKCKVCDHCFYLIKSGLCKVKKNGEVNNVQ